MSLKPCPIRPVPETTARVARAAFPKVNPYLTLRDRLGTLFRDEDFVDVFSTRGQPVFCPWRLALVTILQFREHLADRQAAEAVRARIDWKYLLGLELTDLGFDCSVLCEFRVWLMAAGAELRLLEKLLEGCRAQGLLKARGRQRTDATHVLAAVRELNRLELVGETLRAALNELATVAPEWLSRVFPPEWYTRYGRRIEDSRLPQTEAARQVYAQIVGEDGFCILALVDQLELPLDPKQLPQVQALRTAWRRHYEREDPPGAGAPQVHFKTHSELAQAEEDIVSPYDPRRATAVSATPHGSATWCI
jgi:transposase